MWSSSCFSSVFLLPQFFFWMWIAFFLISPSELFWIVALLLAEKSIMFNCTTVYSSLCIIVSWFCSFHSESIPGGHSSWHGIPPVHYSFEHNSILSPTDTTICSAIPQWKDIPSFSNFSNHKECGYKYFCRSLFPYYLFWGYKPRSGMAGSKGRQSFIALWA